ncbi:MAG: hypothetical protein WC852_02005 [Candidatus Nanoarchaeia archaeon]|jgi:hypothetical protein
MAGKKLEDRVFFGDRFIGETHHPNCVYGKLGPEEKMKKVEAVIANFHYSPTDIYQLYANGCRSNQFQTILEIKFTCADGIECYLSYTDYFEKQRISGAFGRFSNIHQGAKVFVYREKDKALGFAVSKEEVEA